MESYPEDAPERSPEPRFRHARDVDAMAPKPGHHLATVSFRWEKESVLLWLIEGPENDALSVRGMATTFDATRYFRFRLRGLGIESLCDLPYSPYDHRLTLDLDVENGLDLVPSRAELVFSTSRGPNGVDPDAAFMRVTCGGGTAVDMAITELRRAWLPLLTATGAALALPHVAASAGGAGVAAAGGGSLRVSVPDRGVSVGGDYEASGGLRSSARLR